MITKVSIQQFANKILKQNSFANLKKYRHIFFDWDHTLWDFEKNSKDTLKDLYVSFDLSEKTGVDIKEFIKAFEQVNRMLWTKYNAGNIDREAVRNTRFELIFQGLSVEISPKLTASLNKAYLNWCSKKSSLMAGASDLLQYLSKNYRLHILTNGFKDVQHTKIESAIVAHYFEVVVTSECCPYKKPNPGIFDFALKQTNARVSEAIIIGDGLDTDIQGAINYGMDCIFFNSNHQKHNYQVTHEITALSELKDFF